jgi:cell filamentation protein
MSERFRQDDNPAPSNRFGITNHADLQRLETPLALRRLLELQESPIRGSFDAEHLRAVHRYIFQDVSDWAGRLRAVSISKPGALFPPPQYLRESLDALFDEVAREGLLKGLSRANWARRAAYHLGEINAIHPFREGNGRTQREFIRELALAGGHRLTWAARTQEEMIGASQLSFLRKDYSGLEEILASSLDLEP